MFRTRGFLFLVKTDNLVQSSLKLFIHQIGANCKSVDITSILNISALILFDFGKLDIRIIVLQGREEINIAGSQHPDKELINCPVVSYIVSRSKCQGQCLYHLDWIQTAHSSTFDQKISPLRPQILNYESSADFPARGNKQHTRLASFFCDDILLKNKF